MKYISLIISLPTENSTVRMRAWRAIKASGAATLRDGVYLLPEGEAAYSALAGISADVQAVGGMACLLSVASLDDTSFFPLFDRSEDYAKLLLEVNQLFSVLRAEDNLQNLRKQLIKLRKNFSTLVEIDFFPGAAQQQVDTALNELELAIKQLLSPHEPRAIFGTIPALDVADYQQKVWATRSRPWVDRLASAWFIQRFIDPKARFLWLDSPKDCPLDAVGFDFDGAAFSHIGSRVTFEVLIASFTLEHPALKRLGELVHYLDVGGVQPSEATGVESVLTGLHSAIADDEQLLHATNPVFDGLLTTFTQRVPT